MWFYLAVWQFFMIHQNLHFNISNFTCAAHIKFSNGKKYSMKIYSYQLRKEVERAETKPLESASKHQTIRGKYNCYEYK